MVNELSIFIDTGVFVAARNRSDINHERAVELLRKALKGEYGGLYTSDYVFDEAVTVALVRTGSPRIALDIGNFILSSRKLKIIHVNKTIFKEAWNFFTKHSQKKTKLHGYSINSHNETLQNKLHYELQQTLQRNSAENRLVDSETPILVTML